MPSSRRKPGPISIPLQKRKMDSGLRRNGGMWRVDQRTTASIDAASDTLNSPGASTFSAFTTPSSA